MLIDAFSKVIKIEEKKPSTKLPQNTGVISRISNNDRYAVKDIAGRVVYGVRGPRNLNKGSSISYMGTGQYSEILSSSRETIPAIVEIEV